jgi:hypothetical protein
VLRAPPPHILVLVVVIIIPESVVIVLDAAAVSTGVFVLAVLAAPGIFEFVIAFRNHIAVVVTTVVVWVGP